MAVGIVEGQWQQRNITPDDVAFFLGPEIHMPEAAERTEITGIATGMAWTAAGGDILFIEATAMPGSGKLRLTGSLGEVMKESAELALSYLRSKASQYGIDPSVFKEQDLHVHVPAGAIPKDGPSAGVTMLTALASLLSGRKVRSDVAMTGEATLRGRVLPVGGIKSKVLAAHRAGYRTVILPAQNEVDLDEVPASVRESMRFVLAKEMLHVLETALEPAAEGSSSRVADDAGVVA